MRDKASTTIEAAIVMSTLLFIIFAIISAFLLLYQNAVMEYVATQAAQQGAVYWTDTSVQMDGSRSGKDDSNGLYYRIGEMAGGNSAKCAYIKKWAEDKMKSMIPRSIVGSGAEQVNVTFKSGLMQRYVIVEIKKEVNIPFASIMQYFNDDLNMRVKVQASVSEPAEYIRTLDFAYVTLSDAWKSISSKLGKITSFFK